MAIKRAGFRSFYLNYFILLQKLLCHQQVIERALMTQRGNLFQVINHYGWNDFSITIPTPTTSAFA